MLNCYNTHKMIRIFQNPEQSAFLSRGNFVDTTLIDECITYVIPLLEEKPEIVVFGKKCRQNRNVGFFSDQSIGYKYSNNLMKSKPLQEKLSLLLGIINNTLGTEFNGILVNEYKKRRRLHQCAQRRRSRINRHWSSVHIIRSRKNIPY